MKALLLTVTALALATPALAAPAHRPSTAVPPVTISKPLLVFEFMGQKTDTPRTMTDLQGESCKVKGATATCANYGFPTVAGRPMRYLILEFFNDRLYMVRASFGEQAYQSVAEAFTTKYGQPAKVETRKWQSKAGASFDNQVLIWKFGGGGTLELESMGEEVGAGRYTFISATNAPPAEAPKVDF